MLWPEYLWSSSIIIIIINIINIIYPDTSTWKWFLQV